MAPKPEEGPVDGQEVDLKIVPHHQSEAKSQGGGGPNLIKLALTGTAIVGGIVGLWFLYKKFFGKKKGGEKPNNGGETRNGRMLLKRELEGENVEDTLLTVYETALQDEGFLEFLEELDDAGFLDELKGVSEP
jgi:hypothetical protein